MAEARLIILSIPAPLMPLERGDLIEDPLDDWLQESGWGEVTGGGTSLGKDGTVNGCDVEIELDSLSEDRLNSLRAFLTGINVPKGSVLELGDGRRMAVWPD